MNKLSKKIKLLIVTIILISISAIFIIINGNTYTIKFDNINEIIDTEKLQIEIDDENIIKCIDKKIENGIWDLI